MTTMFLTISSEKFMIKIHFNTTNLILLLINSNYSVLIYRILETDLADLD